jgi:hypothetical protein
MISEFRFSENIIGFIVEDTLDATVVSKMRHRLWQATHGNDHLNVFLEFRSIHHFSSVSAIAAIGAFFSNSEWFHRIAIVTDHTWLRGGVQNVILPIAVEVFSSEQRVKALRWVMEADTFPFQTKAETHRKLLASSKQFRRIL